MYREDLVIASCVGSDARYAALLRRSAAQLAPDVELVRLDHQTSIALAYNRVLDDLAARPIVPTVVLAHEDVIVRDRSFVERCLAVTSDASVAIFGVVGGVRPGSLAWHNKTECFGTVE